MYFIFYSAPQASLNNGDAMVFDAKSEDSVSITLTDNRTKSYSIKQVLNLWPELKVPYKKGILTPKDFTKEESILIEKATEASFDFKNFKNLTESELKFYVESAYKIDFDRLKFLKDHKYDALVNDFCGKGLKITRNMFDIMKPNEQKYWIKSRDTQLVNLYNA